MSSTRASLRQVARAAGVSLGTASEALRDFKWVNPETRARVQAAAERLGYRPEPLYSLLGQNRLRPTRRSRVEVVILTSEPRARGVSVLQRELDKAGYHATPCVVQSEQSLVRAMAAWRRARVRGVILRGFAYKTWFSAADWDGFSLVGAMQTSPCGISEVHGDAAAGIEMAVEAACSRGYSRIGVVLPSHDMPLMDDRLREGMMAVMVKRYPNVSFFCVGEVFDRPWAEQMTRLAAWIKASRPDAIVGHVIACEAARSVDPRIPALTFDIGPHKNIEGVAWDFEQIAQLLIDMLGGMIKRGEVGIPKFPISVRVAPRWYVPGQTSPSSAGV